MLEGVKLWLHQRRSQGLELLKDMQRVVFGDIDRGLFTPISSSRPELPQTHFPSTPQSWFRTEHVAERIPMAILRNKAFLVVTAAVAVVILSDKINFFFFFFLILNANC